jgi:very-short-patch-repair endonuclease
MPKPTKYAFMLMKALKLLGVKFRPEYWDNKKHIDIVIPSSKINIEVDGRQHLDSSQQILKDLSRSERSLEKGFSTIHVTNNAIYDSVGGVASALAEASAIKEEEIQKQNTSGNQGALI